MKIVGIQQPDRGVSGGSTVRGRLPRECRVHSRRVLVGSRRQARDDSDRATPAGSRHRVRSTGPAGREDGLHRTELSCPRRRGELPRRSSTRLSDSVRPVAQLPHCRRHRCPRSSQRAGSRLGRRGGRLGWAKSLPTPLPTRPLQLSSDTRRSTISPAGEHRKLTSQWILGKNGDRSGPLGPMVPASEVGDLRDGLRIQTRVNGEIVQDAPHRRNGLYSRRHPLSHLSDLHTAPRRSSSLRAHRRESATHAHPNGYYNQAIRSRSKSKSLVLFEIHWYPGILDSKAEQERGTMSREPSVRDGRSPRSPSTDARVPTFADLTGDRQYFSDCIRRRQLSQSLQRPDAGRVTPRLSYGQATLRSAFVSSPTISRNTKTSRSTTGSVVGGGSDPPLNPSDAARAIAMLVLAYSTRRKG